MQNEGRKEAMLKYLDGERIRYTKLLQIAEGLNITYISDRIRIIDEIANIVELSRK